MSATGDDSKAKEQFGAVTRMMAGHCHSCKMCAYAEKKPDKLFSRFIRWHHSWCPSWAAHKKVYGEQGDTPAENQE